VARSNDKTVKVGRHSRRQIKAKSADNGDAVHGSPLSSKSRIVALVAAGAIAIAGSVAVFLAAGGLPMPERLRASDPRPAAFVGSEACADCHQAETALWKQSQHKHAMQHASAASVLGDFENARFDYFDVHSRFFKKDNKFFVETDGPDGKLATFEIKYTFGISPLQQYLVEFPDGRIQALSTAWDSRPKDQGGQHWFHLYPNEEIKHDDVLHWTKLNQNWNFMCAECHSTGVRKNYDAAKDNFHTTWAEVSVGCEACHGKGSRHVDWAYSQRSWSKDRQSSAQYRPCGHAAGGRDLRSMPCTPRAIFRRLDSGTAFV
jgi:hypothetical protein